MTLLFDLAAILNSIVSRTYYEMLRGPKHPMTFNLFQNCRRIAEKVHYAELLIGITQPNIDFFL